MHTITRNEVIMPGGIELTKAAENYMSLNSESKLLSVACGTGEIELYLAEKYSCQIIGIDSGQNFIAKAQKKALDRNLQDFATFEIGNGNSLDFEAGSFDIVFCSGALCAFFHNGLKEFFRVLKPKGRAVIIDVLWRQENIPQEAFDCWSGGTAHILTLDGNDQAFKEFGFRTIYSKEYHEPSWWEAYYDDMGNARHWQEERGNYQAQQDYIGLGLFVIER